MDDPKWVRMIDYINIHRTLTGFSDDCAYACLSQAELDEHINDLDHIDHELKLT